MTDNEVGNFICDVCGRDCRDEYMKLHAMWGLLSKNDGEMWDADLCESCVEKILIPVVKFHKQNYLNNQV